MLRDYQQNTIDWLEENCFQDKKLLVVAPTGAGKSVIIKEFINLHRDKTFLILVHKNNLLLQMAEHLTKTDLHFNLVCQYSIVKQALELGYNVELQTNITIASKDTIKNKLYNNYIYDYVIIDEAHHAVSTGYMKLINYFKSSQIIGFTATPQRLDGKPLKEVADEMYIVSTTANLIRQGFLSQYKMFCPTLQDFNNIKKTAGDFNNKDVYTNNKIQFGDVILHYKRICNNKQTLVSCINIQHSKEICDDFIVAGYNASIINSTQTEIERLAILRKFERKEITILCFVDCITEGVDIPICEALIMLRPTASLVFYLQECGRILRPHSDKEYAIIIDHVGNIERFGSPAQNRSWSLESNTKRKEQQEKAIKFITCKKCFNYFAVVNNNCICPFCKEDNTPEYTAKVNLEIEIQNTILKEKKEQLEYTQLQEKNRLLNRALSIKDIANAKTMEDLLAIQRNMGYKNGWAFFQAKRKGIIK